MDWASFAVGVVVTFCVMLGLPWFLVLIIEVYERVKSKIKGGGVWVVKKIKEISSYSVYDDKDNLLKKGFKDVEDAFEYGVNYLLSTEATKVVIKGEITITVKR